MIKFTTNTILGTVLVGFGISDANIERLKTGSPILVDLRDLGITEPIEIMIFHGKTEEIMAQKLMETLNVQHVFNGKKEPI